jgi:sugar/nucleoside kinase (ribokinase family)
MLDALYDAGVHSAGIVVSADRPTGLSVILLDAEDRAILTSTGTIDSLDAGAVDLDLVRAVRHVHVSSYFLQRGLQAGLPSLFDEAHRAGATTSLDPNWDAGGTWDSGLRDLLPKTDAFLPNAAEALAITETDDVTSAARALAEHAEVVAVKCGREGGLAMRGRETARAAIPPVVPADTIGAGDTFDAAFVAGRLAGWPLDRCLKVAVACGSLSTRGVGGTATQPTMDEALAAVEAMP